MNFSGFETIFFYKIDGILRQALELLITNQTNAPKSGTVTISTPGYETLVTELSTIKEGTHSYIVYEPVVYPNFVVSTVSPDFVSKSVGRQRTVLAKVKLEVGSDVEIKEIMIGTHRPWTIYVCQDVCTDFTWHYSEDETVKLSTNLTDAHLKAIKETKEMASDSQNRWNINQAMEAKWYVEKKSAIEIKNLINRERDGHVQISPIFNSCITATMSTEQAIRSLYFARELERKYGIDLSVVEHIEVPTIAWGMATIFAGAGIKYMVKGWFDRGSTPAPYCIWRDDLPLYYWEGPDGSRVLRASDKGANLRASYRHARFLMKAYEDAVRELHGWWIPHFEDRTDYPYDAFILLGSHGDIGKHSSGQIKPLIWNIVRYNSEPWEYPKIINANWRQFFKHIELFMKTHKVTPQVLRGDYGSSWDEWPANLAAVFAGVRRGVEHFVTAEKLATLASRLRPEGYAANRAKLEIAELRMVQIPEHAWNGTSPQERLDAFNRRQRWQKELNEKADSVITEGLNTIASSVPTGKETSLLVFNCLPWNRTSVAEVKGVSSGPFTVTDESTGQAVLSEVVRVDGEEIHRFVARDVPSIGYKIYTIFPASRSIEEKGSVKVEDNVIENKFYRIEVNPSNGGLQSVYDKQRNVELVDLNSPYKLNQYVYLSKNTEYTPQSTKISPGPKGPVSGSIVIEMTTLRSKIRTTVILYSEIDRIDITNEVTKTPSSEPTQIHFFFPFNVPDCAYNYEATASIIKPGLTQYGGEQLRGSGQEFHSCRQFVDISNNEYGLTLSQVDSYLIQFGHRTTYEAQTVPDPSNSTVLSLVMMNKCPRMLVNQGGISDFVFRYAIRGHKGRFQPLSAVQFGWEGNNELLVKTLPSNQNGDLPPKSYSFLSCNEKNVVITTLKVAEEGLNQGLIIRAWETSGKATKAVFDVSALQVTSAIKTDLLERNQEKLHISNGKIEVQVPARGFVALRLNLKKH